VCWPSVHWSPWRQAAPPGPAHHRLVTSRSQVPFDHRREGRSEGAEREDRPAGDVGDRFEHPGELSEADALLVGAVQHRGCGDADQRVMAGSTHQWGKSPGPGRAAGRSPIGAHGTQPCRQSARPEPSSSQTLSRAPTNAVRLAMHQRHRDATACCHSTTAPPGSTDKARTTGRAARALATCRTQRGRGRRSASVSCSIAFRTREGSSRRRGTGVVVACVTPSRHSESGREQGRSRRRDVLTGQGATE